MYAIVAGGGKVGANITRSLLAMGHEVVELQVSPEAPAAGKRVAGLSLPDEVRLVSITRNGVAEVAGLDTVIRPGDQVIAILKPGLEDRLRKALVG